MSHRVPWPERYRDALQRAAGRTSTALLTGPAALALHRFAAAPPPAAVPVVDVLVPPSRRFEPPPGLRIHHARRLPPPVRLPPGLPAAPPLHAALDAIRTTAPDRARTRVLLHELLDARGCPSATLAAALRAENLQSRPDVAPVLTALGPAAHPPAETRARTVLSTASLPPPVWHPSLHLDGYWLANPDAYWPRRGILLELDQATRHRDDPASQDRAVAHHNTLESLGLHLIHATSPQLFRAPDTFVAAVFDALRWSPHGPAHRIVML